MTKENLKGMPVEDLAEKMKSLGHSAFHGRQIFCWINQRGVTDFEQMTDLSKSLRKELAEKFFIPKIEIAEKHPSEDGTIKYLVRLEDGGLVETVYIPKETRRTLCVSTQLGCKMGCTFCATGYMGWKRNLKSWEIVDQLIGLPFPKPITNIVMMGMGEPFDNYEEVMKALRIFSDPRGPKIGKKHITVSTVGLNPKMAPFIESNLGLLAISLHGTTEEQRATIMPVSRKYPISSIMETCRALPLRKRHKVTFEYLMIRDFNDSLDDARRLAKITNGIPSKVNLIAYNENQFVDFKRPTEERVLEFQRILLNKGITATYRRSRGRDIAAACGQLNSIKSNAS